MGKRSDGTFARRPMDSYDTPYSAVPPLLPFLRGVETFAEPCAGNGKLIEHLEGNGLKCTWRNDITWGYDALKVDIVRPQYVDCLITNPPWTREILHPMILHFQRQAPTFLLFDADWAHNKHAEPYLDQCSHIIAVGRLKWIEGSPHAGKDNVCWYRFHAQHEGGPRFYGRSA